MDMFGLEFKEVSITRNPNHEEPTRRFVWAGDDLLIRTTKNPLTGEKARYYSEQTREQYNPDDHLAKTGYIHLEGNEEAVREAVEHIKNNSNYKAVSVGRWDY
jgi:hypothetical protein